MQVMNEHDPVASPSHYCHGSIETKDLVEKMMHPVQLLPPIAYFWWGNAFKYLVRWPWKNGVEDLMKCRQCLENLKTEIALRPRQWLMVCGCSELEFPWTEWFQIERDAAFEFGYEDSLLGLWSSVAYYLWIWPDNYGCSSNRIAVAVSRTEALIEQLEERSRKNE